MKWVTYHGNHPWLDGPVVFDDLDEKPMRFVEAGLVRYLMAEMSLVFWPTELREGRLVVTKVNEEEEEG